MGDLASERLFKLGVYFYDYCMFIIIDFCTWQFLDDDTYDGDSSDGMFPKKVALLNRYYNWNMILRM